MSKPQPGRDFFDLFKKPTGSLILNGRSEVLDKRIRDSGLTLVEKIEVFRLLSPPGDFTDQRKELRMERLLLSIPPESLTEFKFALEYDGDYKDMAEYVFHDIDDDDRQDRIIEHLRSAPQFVGIKVLTDVDDTMYANLIDERYPRKTTKKILYPGVLEFYDSLKREPFDVPAIPVTTLSARPNPIGGTFEESSLEGLIKVTNRRLLPSALSGELMSGAAGSLQTWLRANAHLLGSTLPHGEEDKIGEVKFENFSEYSKVYPEYRYVFIGDSGQADALTAQLMLTKNSSEGTSRVVTTFIHDLRQSEDDDRSVSQTFRKLPSDLLISSKSAAGRGVIVFRNYIAAAVVACSHSKTLDNLVTATHLARISRSALTEFQNIDFAGKETSQTRLRQQYREDAEEAYKILTTGTSAAAAIDPDVREIRQLLDGQFGGTSATP